jgi:hypothetical protein
MTTGSSFVRYALVIVGCVVVVGCANEGARSVPQNPDSPPLEGRDPIRVITEADEPVVLMGEHHGWSGQHAFLRQLVDDPVIHRRFDDVVVEFGNARFQVVIDAYISGDRVSRAKLSKVWSETTQGSTWESRDYARFFQSVRRSNRIYPAQAQLRVLLGDPPIDPARIGDARELDLWVLQRGAHFASVILRDVVARRRRALVIAGVAHVVRRPLPLPTLTNLLEGSGGCSPDPKAVAKGINWCDNLKKEETTQTFVVVPYRLLLGPREIQEQLDEVTTPTILPVRKSMIEGLPLAAVLGAESDEDGSSWTARDGFDALLVGIR